MDKAGRLTDLMFVIGGVVFDFGWERNSSRLQIRLS